MKTERTVWTMCPPTWVAEICQCEVLREITCEGVRERGTAFFFLFVQSAHVSLSEHANVAAARAKFLVLAMSQLFSLVFMGKSEFLTFGRRVQAIFNFSHH